MFRRSWIVLLVVNALLVPARASAITCRRPGTAAEELARHSAVFEGRVVSEHSGRRVRLVVLRSWKGAVAGQHFALWWANSALGVNGPPMRVGQTYLVFARPPPQGDETRVGWADGICGPTSLVGQVHTGLSPADLGPPLATP